MSLESILNSFGIEYVSTPDSKAVNVNCPFCRGTTKGLPDYRFLCGIFRNNSRYHCFRCNRKGSFKYLLKAIADITDEEYDDLFTVVINNNENAVDIVREKMKRVIPKQEEKTLEEISGELITKDNIKDYALLERFIKERKITVETLIKYKCRVCGCVGKYAHRLILPVFDGNKIVSFQARDLTGKAKKKYDNPKISVHNYIYKTEFSNSKHVYIVEGIFDAWRMRYNTVAIFGKSVSKMQSRLLRNLNMNNYIFCLDSDAFSTTIKEMRSLSDYVDRVGIVNLPKGKDPDDLGRWYIEQLPVRWSS